MTDSVYKYGEDIIWSLPMAFGYEMIWGAIVKSFKNKGIDLPRINGFGAPNCQWAGGRISSMRQQLDMDTIKRILDYYDSINMTPAYTFTCTSLEPEEFKDPYTNYLLDASLERDAHFIIYDDRLKDYIRSKKSDAYCVASVIKPTVRYQGPGKLEASTPEGESAFYNELLKEYDLVVVRPEYSETTLLTNPEMIDDISRIEVLINQHCIKNCPRAPEHYRYLESVRLDEKRSAKKLPHVGCIKGDMHDTNFLENTLCHPQEVVEKLVEHGVKHLKVQGRTMGPNLTAVLMEIYTQVFNCDGPHFLHVSDLAHGAVDSEAMYFDNEILHIRRQMPPQQMNMR